MKKINHNFTVCWIGDKFGFIISKNNQLVFELNSTALFIFKLMLKEHNPEEIIHICYNIFDTCNKEIEILEIINIIEKYGVFDEENI